MKTTRERGLAAQKLILTRHIKAHMTVFTAFYCRTGELIAVSDVKRHHNTSC